MEEEINSLNERIKKNTQNPEDYYLNGKVSFSNLEYDKAVDNFTKAIFIIEYKEISASLHYKNELAYLYRGLAYVLKLRPEPEKAIGDFTNAINIVEKKQTTDPLKTKLFLYRGTAYITKKNFDKAIEDLSKVTDTRNDMQVSAFYLRGRAYYGAENYDAAINDFIKAKMNFFEIVGLLSESKIKDEDNKIKNALLKIIRERKDSYFNKIVNEEIENKTCYEEIYVDMLLILRMLHVNTDEMPVAHYTSKSVAQELLFNNSKFRLSSIAHTNDPTEGNILLKVFDLKECDLKNESTNNVFIGCFSFNYDNLNQYRLYAKQSGNEASGVCISVKKMFFTDNIKITFIKEKPDLDGHSTMRSGQEQDRELPLFRCIYIDFNINVLYLGHKEEINYINEGNPRQYNDYEKEIKERENKIKNIMKEDLYKTIKNNSNLETEIIIKLLLPLRYLVKHIAFKEEQECRIFSVEDKTNKNIGHNEDYSKMWIDYISMKSNNVEKVIFAPKSGNIETFNFFLKQKGITSVKSDLPFQ